VSGPSLTVYEKPTCSTCQRVVALLSERGAELERVDFLTTPLDSARLRTLLAKAGLRPRDVLRLKEPGAEELPLDDDEAVLVALAARPQFLQRPLVERDGRVVLARPPERALELLD
jgi:arsenate reductase